MNQKFIIVMENLHLFELSNAETGCTFSQMIILEWDGEMRSILSDFSEFLQIPQNFRKKFIQKEGFQNLWIGSLPQNHSNKNLAKIYLKKKKRGKCFHFSEYENKI